LPDDAAAIARTLAGEREAFRGLVLRYQGPLFGYVGKLLGLPSEVEDIVQDVFCLAYSRLGSFDPRRGRFSTWLFTIARNRCFNRLTARRREPTEPPAPGAEGLAASDGPLERAASKELFASLDQALARVPAEQRSAFVLAVLEGLPLAEIARIEGVPVGTIKSRISRARSRLRANVGETLRESLP